MNNKLNIEEIKYLIPDYITGNLDVNGKTIVENAIKESPEVNAFYKEMKATFDFAGKVKFQEPPQQYWNNLLPRIHQRIEAEKDKKAARNPLSILWKILVPVAAVVLIFIIYQLAFSPEKQIVNENKFIEQKEFKNNNTEESKDKKENKIEEKKEDKIAKDNNTEKSANNNVNHKSQKRSGKTNDDNENNLQNFVNNDNSNKENLIKENLTNNDKEELASIDVDESSITITGQGAGFDEEIESDLNKLDDTEQNKLLEQLSSSNL